MRTSRATRYAVAAATAGALALTGTAATASPGHGHGHGHGPDDGVQLERLDRGLVAASTSEGVFLSWRLLGQEVTGATATGMAGPGFAVFRDGRRIATVKDSTSYVDADGDATARYAVAPLRGGKHGEPGKHGNEGRRSATVTAWDSGHLDIPLNKPAGGVTPAGEEYTYSANDASVADLDGDGTYEIVLKWDPSNSKDVSQKGYTGNQYLDAYELDGTQLWRIDLGVNIRAGAHYTQFPVYDFDGDGRAEVMVKTAPGSKVTTYRHGKPTSTRYVSIPKDDRRAGVTHADDYRYSADDYAEHLVRMFQGWSEQPEVVSGQWPATLEEAFGVEQTHDYPLSEQDARELVDYFIDVYAPGRSARNDLRTFEGFVISGPEYLSVFDGRSGRPLDTVDYEPGRFDDGLRWGDYAMSRIEPGNRVDRFLSGVAYLDGEHPSAVFARGYYTRTTLVAYDWDGRHLSKRWDVDSGWTPMSNPFDDGPHGVPGTDPEFGLITTQGFHSMSAADVDGDGRQEIVYGAATIDDDGSLLYSSFDTLPEGSANPGASAGLGHGDAMHVSDLDPARPGLEIWTCHEGGAWAPYGSAMRDAATGDVLFGAYSGRDTGRCLAGDVRTDVPGLEVWASMPDGTDASGLLSASGEQLGAATPGTNQSVRWAADGSTQIITGAGDVTPQIVDGDGTVRETLEGTRTNNGTKGNPSLVADVLGDWREEVLVRTADSSALRLYLSTEVADTAMYTLMHDPQYRAEVARKQTTYNQPSYPGFYLASDTDWSQVPLPRTSTR
ncbi:rhamnogalacturonan lyase [Isoptericola sp. NEAU-Y5]|uniref:Rhamnogalacturonan lyase n=1 Tax=Isoptericola luteus TaxID=2879484 RepID=A0ABS7ZCT5_9MICO|nr:rhamnogalacturonan lyase [Isoptericola sp. NEAU-Y5]MCA5892252.1 rhamnogalacturonan lyase [Isoptericola sp. NEAU-Y5]